jgi:hypothetical protein
VRQRGFPACAASRHVVTTGGPSVPASDGAKYHALRGIARTLVAVDMRKSSMNCMASALPIRVVMTEAERSGATMQCPQCGTTNTPLAAASTFLIAWYICDGCHEVWSARLRDGRPAIGWHHGETIRATAPMAAPSTTVDE